MTNQPNPLVSVTAETQVVNQNGDLETFDSFVERNVRSVETLSITNTKKFASSYVANFSGVLDTDTNNIIQLQFSTGETFECLPGSKVLLSDSRWVPIETLNEGSAIKAVVYNPSHRNPQKTLKEIVGIEKIPAPMIPAIGFTVETQDNILVAIEGKQTFILLPLRPVLL